MNERLENFLKLVAKYQVPPRERTIFSLGARGYYENPASDLLAFFLRPNAEHGFGALFLSALFECMGLSTFPELTGATVEREIKTQLGNRMDLLIIGADWCLILENKIWHLKRNPFEDYEKHARALRKTPRFAVLSPDGESVKTKNHRWVGIKYADYCARLRVHLGQILFDAPHSKWHLLAREFILHIESELYTPIMTSEQARFVEQHAAQMLQVQTLLQKYPEYLCLAVKKALDERLSYAVEVTPGWAVIIKSPAHWGYAYIALRPPTEIDRGDRSPDSRFDVSIYPEDGDLKKGQSNPQYIELLKDMRHLPKHGCWVTTTGFNDLLATLDFILARIKLIEKSTSV